jgi:hypothetical protein
MFIGLDHDDGPCLPFFQVWSSSSKNKVPVANLHTVQEISKADRGQHAMAVFEDAHKSAMDALVELKNFSDTNLEVVLFSGEGDSVHQIFDCIVMGPHSRVDFWDRGAGKDLEVPFWARDASETGIDRTMDLPCFGSKLKGDTIPPFTCGSDTRRSIIKYFVRNHINKGKQGNSLTEDLIREQIRKLIEAWNNTAAYACDCPKSYLPVKNSLECCNIVTLDDLDSNELCLCADGETKSIRCCQNQFLPRSLDVLFDEIPAEDVVRKIVDQIDPFLQRIFTEPGNEAFTLWNNKLRVKKWNWTDAGLDGPATKVSGLYDSNTPIMYYNGSEAGYPFKGGRTIWQMCEGLLRQVIFTMPMAPLVVNKTSGDWMWTAATILSMNTKFDPLQEDYDDGGGLSTLEKFVRKVLDGAFQESPLFWHYAMRHVPSDSLVCAKDFAGQEEPLVGKNLVFTDTVDILTLDPGMAAHNPAEGFPLFGYASFSIGSSANACLCGWKLLDSTTCQISISARDDCQNILNMSGCLYPHGSKKHELEIISAWKPSWECPNMQLSDGWGIVPSVNSHDWLTFNSAKGSSSSVLSASLPEVIHSGRAGLRLGNMKTLAAAAREGMKPKTSSVSRSAAQKRCASRILKTFDPMSLAKSVADDLFPVAQGVSTESWPVSVCLRFSVEYSILRVLRTLESSPIMQVFFSPFFPPLSFFFPFFSSTFLLFPLFFLHFPSFSPFLFLLLAIFTMKVPCLLTNFEFL